MELRDAECPKCGHAWVTRSEADWITCPSCQLKSRREKVLE